MTRLFPETGFHEKLQAFRGDVKHVLLLIPTLHGGGAERVIVTLAKFLSRTQFRLTLAVVDSRRAVFLDEIPRDIQFISLNASRVRYALPKIVRLIWRLQPDVVLSTLGHLNLALAMVKLLLPSGTFTIARETVVVSHGLRRYAAGAIWAAFYRWFYRQHDLVICQSRDMCADIVANFGVPAARTRVINNPVNQSRIRELCSAVAAFPALPGNATILVAAGRLDYQKGFDILIEALSLVDDSRVHVIILGEGSEEQRLKQQAEYLGLTGRVHFAGFQTNPYAWFSRADAFVLSSRYEGFPNVVLEALTCGTPVIAVPAPGGTREILDDMAGCVVAGSVEASALAGAMIAWLGGPRERIASTAVLPYRLEHIVGEYERVLAEGVRP